MTSKPTRTYHCFLVRPFHWTIMTDGRKAAKCSTQDGLLDLLLSLADPQDTIKFYYPCISRAH